MGFEIINASQTDTVKKTQELTDGKGADCIVEASGLPATTIQTIEAASVFGQIVLLGDHHKDVTLSGSLLSSVLRRELTLYGTWNSKITPAGKSDWDMVLNQMQSNLQVGPLISHIPLLSEGPQIFEDIASHRVWYNKVIFAISPEAQAENPR
jgi:L-iditol 2-dehydrogenase/galactitol-1-phosphate 5-dehydrogenase